MSKTLEELIPDLQYSIHVGQETFIVVPSDGVDSINIVEDLLTRVIPMYTASKGQFEPLIILVSSPEEGSENLQNSLTTPIISRTLLEMSKESQLRYVRDMRHALLGLEQSIEDEEVSLQSTSISALNPTSSVN